MTLGLTLGRIGLTRMKRGGGVLAINGTPPVAVQNAAYSFTPNATGGSGTKSFALTGTLPSGLSFNTTTGAITGTPTVVATTSGLNITVTDTSGSASLGVFSLSVVAPLAISGTPGGATQNSAYTFTPGTSGGSGTKTFALTGTLPTGLSFSTSTGAITGTPTVVQTATGLNITVTDSTGSSSLGTFSIAVASSGVLRGSGIQFVNNTSSQAIAIPAAAVSGDRAVIFAEHGWGINTPSGWNLENTQSAGGGSGATFSKTLNSTDISTGSVTVTFTGTYDGVLAIAVLKVGGVNRDLQAQAASGSQTSATTPVTGDTYLGFASFRGLGPITIDKGTQLQTTSNTNAAGTLNAGLIPSNGAFTHTPSYTNSGNFTYEVLYVIVS